MLVVTELPGEHAAGDRDRDIGSLAPDLGQGLVASRRDFALGPVTGGLGLGPGQLDDLLAAGLGLLLGLIEDGLDPFVGLGHQPAMLGEELLALVAKLLGLQQRVFEMLLALMQGLGERLPGKPPQHPKEADENHDRPDGQRGLNLQRIGLALIRGGMVRALGSSRMGRFRLGRRPIGSSGSCGDNPAHEGHQQEPGSKNGNSSPKHDWSLAFAGCGCFGSTKIGGPGPPRGEDRAKQRVGKSASSLARKSDQTIICSSSAKNVTPSISAAAMIMAVWMLPAISGWRAMLSTAALPSIPIPIAAPTMMMPAPIALRSSGRGATVAVAARGVVSSPWTFGAWA